ncbi:MAG TPA: AAA family ATPase [Candidatus Binataceae bacterium]|nr:AAA family ATPase [Candidatus Binataceae bacterium]
MKHSEAALVGRQREVEELLGGVEEATEGHGRVFLITGEPGIGKTRLAEEVAAHGRRRGAVILWSRCWNAAGTPAYWPWIQLIKGCLAQGVSNGWRAEAEPAIADISRILPAAGGISRQRRPARLPEDPEEIRFRLFEAVLTLLKAASRRTPLIVVLDDLGAADLPSLLLLKYLARELYDSRIFLLATYRDSDVRSSPLLADALGELSREAKLIALHGLGRDEVVDLVRGQIPISAETGDALARASGGNPFFVQSILKLGSPEFLLHQGQVLGQGRIRFILGLRAAIAGHLAPLSGGARKVLEVASAIGREFDAAVLAAALGLSHDKLLEILASAEDCGLIVQAFEASGWHYRFVHSMVADGLYEGMPAVQRQRLHGQIGKKIEELYAEDLEPRLGLLAHHFFEGARLGESGRAREYAERAAAHATEMVAFEEAARFYQMALAAMGTARRADRRHRCELLLAMGEAQHRGANYDAARDSFSRASEVAAQLGDSVLLAHAALGYPGLSPGVSSPLPEEAIRLLERALKALPNRDDPWRAMIMAQLASELPCDQAASARRRELVEMAVAMARRTGDKSAVLTVLEYRDLTLSGPNLLEARMRNADEMTQVAEKIGNHFGVYIGSLARVDCLRQWGDISKAQAEIDAMTMLGRMTRLSVCGWGAQCFDAYRALLAGRFEDGQRLAFDATEFAPRMRGVPSPHIFWPAMIMPYREQHRLGEIEPLVIESLRQRPTSAAYRAMLASVNLHLGRTALARAEYEAIAADGFAKICGDGGFLACFAALAELCAAFDDASRAGELLRILEPHARLNAVFGPLAGYGSVARYLGLLAATASRFAEAADYFDRALAMNYQTDARIFAAYTRADYAAMLLKRGSNTDVIAASRLLAGLHEYAEAIGMLALAERVSALGREIEARLPAERLTAPGESSAIDFGGQDIADQPVTALEVAPSPTISLWPPYGGERSGASATSDRAFELLVQASSAASATAPTALSREGDYWTIDYNGERLRLKHLKGLACLAVLLAHPDTDVHSLNLAMITERQAAEPTTTELAAIDGAHDGIGDAGPMLDARAKAEYKRRLTQLREDLAEAREAGDLNRVARAEDEIDFIGTEISRAVGLGGRDRIAASATERARLSVTKSIKSAVAKIAQQNRDLGAHLAATIRTGNFCSYRPDSELPMSGRFA